jgi:sugar phosphate isomerase/epimerase
LKPISLQLYSVREAAAGDFAGVLKRVAAAGYDGVEFAGLHGLAPKDVRALVDDLGLQVSSAHMAIPSPENAAQLIEECGILGVPTLVAGVGPDQVKTLDGVKETAARFQQGAELMAAAGLGFAFHNHWWEFQTVEGRIVEDILLELAPAANAELDVYWAQVGGGDAPGSVKRLAARCPLLHMKDGPIDPPQPMTAVGAGKVDIPAVVAAADPKVLKWLIVELDSCATDMMEAVAQSCAYLKGLGA